MRKYKFSINKIEKEIITNLLQAGNSAFLCTGDDPIPYTGKPTYRGLVLAAARLRRELGYCNAYVLSYISHLTGTPCYIDVRTGKTAPYVTL